MTPESTRVHRDAQGRWECRPYLGTDRVTGKRVRPSRTWPAEWDRERAQAACDAWLAEIAPAETGIVSRRLGTCSPTTSRTPSTALPATPWRPTAPSSGPAWSLRSATFPTTSSRPTRCARPTARCCADGAGGRRSRRPRSTRCTCCSRAPTRSGAAPAPKVIAGEPFALYDTDLERLNRSIRAGLDTRGYALGDVSRRTVAFAAYLALNGGFRIGEVCALQRCDWRREGHDVHVGATVVERPRLARQPHTKGKVARNVSMPPRVEREIERHIGWQDGWVNQNRTGPLTPLVTLAPTAAIVRPTVLTARFTALVRELGLPEGTTFHTLRHTHATWLFMHGFDARTVQERLGHADVATTLRIYGSVMPGRDAEAARAFAESMEEGETDADS